MRAIDMHFRVALLPTALLLLSISAPIYAANFTFDYGTPTQCDNFPISWTGETVILRTCQMSNQDLGGSPPYQLTLNPVCETLHTLRAPC